MVELAALFKQARKLSGLSQEALSEKMYMPRSTISKVENGKMELKISDAMRWFHATQAPEVLAAMLCGVDLPTLLRNLSMLVGGLITYIFF